MLMMDCLCCMYFQLGPLPEILTISNLQHVESRIWTCAEPEFRLCRMKLCSSDNHYTNNMSRAKSENLHFNMLLLLTAYKVSAKKSRRVISHDTEKWSKLWRKTQKNLTWCRVCSCYMYRVLSHILYTVTK